MPLTEDEKTAFDELAAKAEGYVPADYEPKGFLSESTLKGRLGKQGDGFRATLETRDTEIAALKTQNEADQKDLKAYRDKGKSAEDLIAQQLAEKDLETAGWKKRATEQTDLAEQRLQHSKEIWSRNALTRMISESGITPARMTTALREAEAELSMSVAEGDNGSYALQLTRDGVPVTDSAAAFGEWWKDQTHLHGSSGGALPPPGASGPPPDLKKDPTAGMTQADAFAFNLRKYG